MCKGPWKCSPFQGMCVRPGAEKQVDGKRWGWRGQGKTTKVLTYHTRQSPWRLQAGSGGLEAGLTYSGFTKFTQWLSGWRVVLIKVLDFPNSKVLAFGLNSTSKTRNVPYLSVTKCIRSRHIPTHEKLWFSHSPEFSGWSQGVISPKVIIIIILLVIYFSTASRTDLLLPSSYPRSLRFSLFFLAAPFHCFSASSSSSHSTPPRKLLLLCGSTLPTKRHTHISKLASPSDVISASQIQWDQTAHHLPQTISFFWSSPWVYSSHLPRRESPIILNSPLSPVFNSQMIR